MPLLILSYAEDLHVEAVVKVLQSRNIPYLIYDLSLYPTDSNISYSIGHNEFALTLRINGQLYNLNEFSAIWYRRNIQPIPPQIADKNMQEYIQRESQAFVYGLPLLLPNVFWVSNPQKIFEIGNNKHYQLLLARESGLKIPDTCIGNDIEVAGSFVKKHPLLALKSFCSSFIHYDLNFSQKIKKIFYDFQYRKILKEYQDRPTLYNLIRYRVGMPLLTQQFEQAQAGPYLSSIPNCPVILQNYVPKKLELRIVIVGKRIFANAIYSQESIEENKIDCRYDVHKNLHAPYTLPPEIERQIFVFMQKTGLQSGSIDMIVTPDNEYVFLEINPIGQWLWTQELTGHPIAEAFADLLITQEGLDFSTPEQASL